MSAASLTGTHGEPPSVKPILGILLSSTDLAREVHEVIAAEVGAIELASHPSEWTMSEFYKDEMGAQIWRQYLSLRDCINAGKLATLKLRTNELEERWRVDGRRRVNLDPGYLDLNKLVLASMKDASQRIYLGGGVFAEATLRYARGTFEPWPYTYRDYASEEAISFFNLVRRQYQEQHRGPVLQ